MGALVFFLFFLAVLALVYFSSKFLHRAIGYGDLLSPCYGFPIIYALVYGLGVLELSPWERALDDKQLILHLAALVFYFAGVFLACFNYKKKEFHVVRKNKHFEKITIYALFLITFVVTLYIFSIVGNPLTSGNTQHVRTLTIQIAGGWLTYIYRTIILSSFLLYAGCRAGLILNDKLITRVAILIIGMLCCVVSGYRAYAITLFFMVIIFDNFYCNKLTLTRSSVYLFIFAFAFALTGALRSLNDYYGFSGLVSVWDRVLIEVQTPAFTLETLQDNIPSKIEYFGLNMLWWPIAALLPGDQPSIGIELKWLLGINWEGGGMAPSISGGYYMIGGTTTVLLGLMLNGYILARSYTSAAECKSIYSIGLYAYLFVYSLNAIRGGFFQEFILLWFVGILLTLGYLFEKRASG